MRCWRSVATAAAALLALVTSGAFLAAPASALNPLLPPTVEAPADGASIPAGGQVTFRVRTDAGDSYLWVHISRSPAPADACGTIGSDVATQSLDVTAADPAVYEGTPNHYDNYNFWLNRAGTYYWQAYRIHYGSGADGCIEAPVRTLNVTGVRPVEIGPQPLSPADGAVLPAGPLTFSVSAMSVEQYLWMRVSRSPAKDATGILGSDAEIEALTQSADPTVWTAAPKYYTTPSFWMNTPGTYYWQPYRISGFGDPDGFVEGPVRSFTVQATHAQTIRGNEAFQVGSANDLYLACTNLNVYLVDVLPAGRRVAVTGAADLRLVGKAVAIYLDGRRVGSAKVASSGAFSTTVRAPSAKRRSKARYQARVGSSRSQNLKLERRMVAVKLTRKGGTLTLTGRLTRPFAKPPLTIGVQRYVACPDRVETVTPSKPVRPNANGTFRVSFAVPAASVRALMYRATTKVPSRPGGRPTQRTYTLPRATNVG